jgi:hypothetical protein
MQKLVHWNQVAIMVFLVHSLPDQLWVFDKSFGISLCNEF